MEEKLLFPSYMILQAFSQFNCMQLLHKAIFDLA